MRHGGNQNMTRMHLRRRVAAVAVGAVVVASTAGAAAAADSGGSPAGKGVVTTQGGVQGPGGKGKPDPKSDKVIAAIAKDLGVSVGQLDDALRATKEWFGTTGAEPTPEAFAAHVGSILHVPSAKVLASFKAHGLFVDKPGGKKPGGKDRGGNSVDLDKAAKDLGVSRTVLEKALVQTKMWIGSSGVKPTPDLFASHVASILGKDADQVLKVLEADGVLDAAPPAKPKAQA